MNSNTLLEVQDTWCLKFMGTKGRSDWFYEKRESSVNFTEKWGKGVFSHQSNGSWRHEMSGGFVVDEQGLV